MAETYVNHWKRQRISAVALIFLFSWFIYDLLQMLYNPKYLLQDLLYTPLNLIGFILLFNVGIYHGLLGFKVICEDYIRDSSIRSYVVMASSTIGFVTIGILTITMLTNFWLKP